MVIFLLTVIVLILLFGADNVLGCAIWLVIAAVAIVAVGIIGGLLLA